MSIVPAQVEAAVARLDALPDPAARAAAHEAVSAILELHGEGLRRLAERLRETSVDADRYLRAVAQDELVASLFVLHGVHPPALATAGRVPASDPTFVPLERLVARTSTKQERCDLCGLVLSMPHEHLFDVERRRLECACTACSLLFDAAAGKRRRVRRCSLKLEAFRIGDAQWQALEVPVGLAFFSYSSSLRNVIAAYPGPAGAVESVVAEAAWADLVRDNAVLAEIEADTAAFLVNRLSATPSYHVLSIDQCYRLTGLVRERWQGLTGGDGPLQAVSEFLNGLSGEPS
jgi:hypothetical protein